MFLIKLLLVPLDLKSLWGLYSLPNSLPSLSLSPSPSLFPFLTPACVPSLPSFDSLASHVRGLTSPLTFLSEDFKKEGKCPAYKAVDGFEIDKYMGIW